MNNEHGIEVNPYESPTELGAVWYAANYYYEASIKSGVEYGGVVFKAPNGRYSVTRKKGVFGELNYVHTQAGYPNDSIFALWHTHLPAPAMKGGSGILFLNYALTELFESYANLSSQDKKVVDDIKLKKGRRISMYAVTATTIKRYRPGEQVQHWDKSPPSRMSK